MSLTVIRIVDTKLRMRFIFSNWIVLCIKWWVLVKRVLFFVGLKDTSQVAAHQINLERSVFKHLLLKGIIDNNEETSIVSK